MVQDILAFAQEWLAKGKQVAFITVSETTGSSPASAGQMMAVLADGHSIGTVGGGATEHQVKQQAMDAIKNGKKVFDFSINHAENGMVCGGGMSGYGNIIGNENHLFIFGGGHVAQCLAPLAVATGFFVTVIEDRLEFESAFPNCRYIVCKPENYEKDVSLLGSAYVVICTRGHKTDGDALHFCLPKSPKYLGMIGSASKVAALFKGLRQDGFSEDALDKIYTPIGLNVASAIPAEIAVAIMAEILLIKNSGSPTHKREAR